MDGLFQSTHPSGVRHAPISAELCVFDISIHAPQWGATVGYLTQMRSSPYFNPRTPVGCDEMVRSGYELIVEFQSTHPSGVRHARHMPTFARPDISIHAPQWGATLQSDFNTLVDQVFQSTHPSGVRRDVWPISIRHMTYFNPRTPVGCDCTRACAGSSTCPFQSTHPSGVRR